MKKLLPSLLLSFFSLPLANLLRYIYFFAMPSYRNAEVILISIVISLNTISLIIAFYKVIINKNPN